MLSFCVWRKLDEMYLRFVTLRTVFCYIIQRKRRRPVEIKKEAWSGGTPGHAGHMRWGMRVAICDDDRESCARLRCLVRRQEPDCEVVCFDTGKHFLEAGKHFDILLLDIQMEEMSGIEVARVLRIKRERTILIFVTALKEYAVEAFEVSAFSYLLKPVEPEKFNRVFADACREVRRLERESGEQLFFQTKARSFVLPKRDILYVESRKRKVEIHTLRENVTVYATMKSMEEQLGEGFFRCHRGFLVNMAYVAEYGMGIIQLQSGETVYLAREKYSEFTKAYTRYLSTARN